MPEQHESNTGGARFAPGAHGFLLVSLVRVLAEEPPGNGLSALRRPVPAPGWLLTSALAALCCFPCAPCALCVLGVQFRANETALSGCPLVAALSSRPGPLATSYQLLATSSSLLSSFLAES